MSLNSNVFLKELKEKIASFNEMILNSDIRFFEHFIHQKTCGKYHI